MNVFKRSISVFCLAALAGCGASVAPIKTTPVEPAYTPASRNLQPNEVLLSTVRAYAKSGGSRTEVSGATCQLKTKYYEAEVIALGTVNLPSYAEKTPPLELSCTYEGKTVTKTLQRLNLTVLQKSNKWYTPGLLGHAVVAAATKDENSVFTYPALFVVFE